MTKTFLIAMTVSMMTSAFADTSRLCSQANSKFIEVAQNYNACNSIMGSDQQACNNFCDDAEKLVGGGYQSPSQGQCSFDQIRRAEAEGREQGVRQGVQQGRDEVLRDLSVREDYVSQDYFGINENDCANRAAQATERLRMEAISRCNNKAASIKNCFIQNEKVTGTFGRPPKFEGTARFDKADNRSNQDECQRTALSQATSTALRKCLEATGTECSINNNETILTHRLQSPSGPRLGRRDSRICDAKVVAEAPRDLSYKCNIRISARNQAFAN